MKEVTEDWKLYTKGIEYNNSLSPAYYPTINRNWRVYNLQHWEGINTKGLPKPKMPMSQRVTRHSVAACMTKDVKMEYRLENVSDEPENGEDQTVAEQRGLAEMLSKHSKDRWEMLKMDALIRKLLLNGANEGDFAVHTYWDASYDTGQSYGEEEVLDENKLPVLDEYGKPMTRPVPVLGEFYTEAVDGCNVFFGNPNDTRINFNGKPFQPYVIIAGREVVQKLRREAKQYQKENKLTDEEIKSLIVPDTETNEQAGDRGRREIEHTDEYGKATYLIKYWPDEKTGTIRFNKSLKGCEIRPKVDTGLTLYPIAWANWDTIKNSYHGQALMTGLVDNQLELDKAWAKFFKYLGDMAFPKAVYNKTYLPNGPTNKIGEAIGYDGSENVKPTDVLSYTQPGQLANGVIDAIMAFQNKTMELLGASDTVLGNATPENTSAIVALTQNASVPLENVKSNLYQFIEDIGYIWLDFMLHKYKVPRKIAINVNGVRQMVEFDPEKVAKAKFRISVDVMPGGYMDEFTQTRAIENLFNAQVIDAVQFIERLPDNAIPGKERLLQEIKEKIAQQQAMQTDEFKKQVISAFLDEQIAKTNAEATAM